MKRIAILLLFLCGSAAAQTVSSFSVTGGATLGITISAEATAALYAWILATPAAGAPTTTLTTSVISTDTTFALAVIPSSLVIGCGVLMGSDASLVTAISGLNVTVTRASLGTTAASHSSGDSVVVLQNGDIASFVKSLVSQRVTQIMLQTPGPAIASDQSDIASQLAGAVN